MDLEIQTMNFFDVITDRAIRYIISERYNNLLIVYS